jgi:hypothetical protein
MDVFFIQQQHNNTINQLITSIVVVNGAQQVYLKNLGLKNRGIN